MFDKWLLTGELDKLRLEIGEAVKGCCCGTLRNYKSLNSDKDGKEKQAVLQEILKGLSRWFRD